MCAELMSFTLSHSSPPLRPSNRPHNASPPPRQTPASTVSAYILSNSEAHSPHSLTVRLGDTLQLVLLLDGVAVGGSLGGVDELVSQTLGDRLDVTEGGLAGARAQQPDGLVDAAQRGHVDGLATDGAGAADTGRVLTRARLDDGSDQNLQRVLPGQTHKRSVSALQQSDLHTTWDMRP